MRLIFAAAVGVIAAIAAAPAARAQESDEDLKRRILDKVRDRLAEERKAILERLSKVIDEELAGAAKKPPAPGAPDAKGADPRIKDLERKLEGIEDQRDDLLRDIRAIRRETEDAKIIQEAKKSPPESAQEAQEEFREYFEMHNDATKDLETNKEKAARGFEKSIAGFKRLHYCYKDEEQMQGLMIPSTYNVACGYALIGKKAEAIDWLEMAIRAGYKNWKHIGEDSDLDSLRKERRFIRLLGNR